MGLRLGEEQGEVMDDMGRAALCMLVMLCVFSLVLGY